MLFLSLSLCFMKSVKFVLSIMLSQWTHFHRSPSSAILVLKESFTAFVASTERIIFRATKACDCKSSKSYILYFLMSIYRRSINMTTIEFVNRERRLKNLRTAVDVGLDEEVKRNKSTLSKNLSVDFNMEITLAETCVYHDDFDGALYHGFMAEIIHRTLKELEVI